MEQNYTSLQKPNFSLPIEESIEPQQVEQGKNLAILRHYWLFFVGGFFLCGGLSAIIYFAF